MGVAWLWSVAVVVVVVVVVVVNCGPVRCDWFGMWSLLQSLFCCCRASALHITIFPWGTLPLQIDWDLSCDHGLDYASQR